MSDRPQVRSEDVHPLVYIVLINYRSPAETLTAVDSVLKMDYPYFRVLVIDNGSNDGSAERLRTICGGRVELIELADNTGFTGGCNTGMRRALEIGAEFVWLLNNDAIVLPGTLTSLVQVARQDPRIGLVSPVIASLDEIPHVTFIGGICDIDAQLYNETSDRSVAQKWIAERPNAGMVIGTAMLVRISLIREIGMFDESFFMYYEDIDLNVRSLKAGYRNVVDWSSTVNHLEKKKNENPEGMTLHYWYYNARNARRFWRKHLGFRNSLRISWWSFNGFMRSYNRCRARPDSQQAILAGLWHGWLGKTGPYNSTYRMPSLPAALLRLYSHRPTLRNV